MNTYNDNTDISNICIFMFIMVMFIYVSIVNPNFLRELSASTFNLFNCSIRILWDIIK